MLPFTKYNTKNSVVIDYLLARENSIDLWLIGSRVTEQDNHEMNLIRQHKFSRKFYIKHRISTNYAWGCRHTHSSFSKLIKLTINSPLTSCESQLSPFIIFQTSRCYHLFSALLIESVVFRFSFYVVNWFHRLSHNLSFFFTLHRFSYQLEPYKGIPVNIL